MQCHCVNIPTLDTNKVVVTTAISSATAGIYKGSMIQGAGAHVKKLDKIKIDAPIAQLDKSVITVSAQAASLGVNLGASSVIGYKKEQQENKKEFKNTPEYIKAQEQRKEWKDILKERIEKGNK